MCVHNKGLRRTSHSCLMIYKVLSKSCELMQMNRQSMTSVFEKGNEAWTRAPSLFNFLIHKVDSTKKAGKGSGPIAIIILSFAMLHNF